MLWMLWQPGRHTVGFTVSIWLKLQDIWLWRIADGSSLDVFCSCYASRSLFRFIPKNQVQLQPRLGSSSLPISGVDFSQPARISKRFSGHRAAHSTVRVEVVRQHSPWDAILSICSWALTNLLLALNDMVFCCYINAILVAVLMCSLGNLDTFSPQCVWKFHWKAISRKFSVYSKYIHQIVSKTAKFQFIEVLVFKKIKFLISKYLQINIEPI